MTPKTARKVRTTMETRFEPREEPGEPRLTVDVAGTAASLVVFVLLLVLALVAGG